MTYTAQMKQQSDAVAVSAVRTCMIRDERNLIATFDSGTAILIPRRTARLHS
jgi:hypothetical protein